MRFSINQALVTRIVASSCICQVAKESDIIKRKEISVDPKETEEKSPKGISNYWKIIVGLVVIISFTGVILVLLKIFSFG